MVRAQKRAAKRNKPKEYLSPSERAELEGQKSDLQTSLRDAEGYGVGTPGAQLDKGVIAKEIKHIEDAIQERTPAVPRATEKDKLVKEEIMLEERIATGMPTWFEMRKPSMNPGAVRKHMHWSDLNVENIRRYKEIQRILRPFEPKSIESLRKEK